MSKALLQREARKAIAEQTARKASEEKPAAAPSSVYVPQPAQIQQIFVYPPVDNTALVKETLAKEKVEELYEAEKVSRAQSHEQHKVALERIKQTTKEQLEVEQRERIKAEELQKEELELNQQLVKEDASLKRRHDIALEKNKADDDTIRRITEENEALKQELEKVRKTANETLTKDEENKVGNIAVPPPYDKEQDAPDIADLILNAPHNDISLTGDIAPESPVEDSNQCAIS
jgi:hypothetical protein